jgi:hypothetical protein
MRRPRLITLLSLALLTAGSALTALPAAGDSTSSAPVSGASAAADVHRLGECRRGIAPVGVANLIADGTVCSRYADGTWFGSAVVTYTMTDAALSAATVLVTLQPDVYPTASQTSPTSQIVHVTAGSPVTVHLTGSQVAAKTDTGVAWLVNSEYPGKFGLHAYLKSPLVLRRSAEAVAGSSFTGTTDWTCSTQPLTYAQGLGTGTATMCLRQSGAAVQAKGSASYTGPAQYTPLMPRFAIAVNGVPETAAAEMYGDLGGNGSITFPSVTTYALRGDLTAAPSIQLGAGVPVFARPIVVQ